MEATKAIASMPPDHCLGAVEIYNFIMCPLPRAKCLVVLKNNEAHCHYCCYLYMAKYLLNLKIVQSKIFCEKCRVSRSVAMVQICPHNHDSLYLTQNRVCRPLPLSSNNSSYCSLLFSAVQCRSVFFINGSLCVNRRFFS